MARPLRLQFPNALYHLTTRGNEQRPIFLSDYDRNQFLEVLNKITKTHKWLCFAYCLMDNHYHLLIETLEPNLSKGMRDLNGIYTQRFNRAHDRCGHIFQGRFASVIIEKDCHLLEAARYIVLNPVRAKMVKNPKDWPWSSYRETAGWRKPRAGLTVDWILPCFSENLKTAQAEYRKFIFQGIDLKNPLADLKEGNILGSQEFADRLWQTNPDMDKIKEIPTRQRMAGRPALPDLLENLDNKKERDILIAAANRRCGYSQKEIADFLGIHYSTISRIIKNSKFKT